MTRSEIPSELRDEIPSFEEAPAHRDHGPIDWTALTSIRTAKSALDGGRSPPSPSRSSSGDPGIGIWTHTPSTSSEADRGHADLIRQRLLAALRSPSVGDTAGVPARPRDRIDPGLVLAAVITQKPFVEKVVAPYIIILVTTPMLALVPFLRIGLIKSFDIWPIVAAVALASGPMVLINASTGFRRTDLAKIALARSYGASTFQIFRTIRFPLALPMIIVGYMVGSIFGLLTAVGGEMVSASDQGGLGHQLVFFSSLIRMANVGAVILIIAVLGVSIYVVFFLIGKRWASWEA